MVDKSDIFLCLSSGKDGLGNNHSCCCLLSGLHSWFDHNENVHILQAPGTENGGQRSKCCRSVLFVFKVTVDIHALQTRSFQLLVTALSSGALARCVVLKPHYVNLFIRLLHRSWNSKFEPTLR